MTRICWWWVDALSRLLEADEREAVRGDLAETGETGGRALVGVLGLVVRRQAALWTHWRPWLALLGLVVPLGVLLSVASRRMAASSTGHIRMYADYCEWRFLQNPGFRHDLAHYVAVTVLEYLALVCWSWTAGFVLGSASRGFIRINRVLFCLMLSFGALLGAPLYFALYQEYFNRKFGLPPGAPSNVRAPALWTTFNQEMFTLLVLAALVMLPALAGMRHDADAVKLGPMPPAILWAAAIVTLAAIVIQSPAWWLLWLFLDPHGPPAFWQRALIEASWGKENWLFQAAACWPLAYLAASAIGRRWHSRTVSV